MRRIRSACVRRKLRNFAPFAASALTDLQLPREFAEAQPAMADSPAMPVLLHQLPDGDTIRQQWAELPPVLGAGPPRWSARARSRVRRGKKKKKKRKERQLRGAAIGLVVSRRAIPVFLTFPTNLIFCQKCGPVAGRPSASSRGGQCLRPRSPRATEL